MPTSLRVHSARKRGGPGYQRVISPLETFHAVRPLMPLIGVTRTGDITGLDCIGIPACTAFRPSSKTSTVYCGKGLTKTDAWVSAMMEAIERYSAETFERTDVRGTYRGVSQNSEAVDPKTMQRFSTVPFTGDSVFDWVNGTDLLTGRDILVPAKFVGFPWTGPGYEGSLQSTNGLASGNIYEEAVAHALAEVIERDATTLAIVRNQLAPQLRRWLSLRSGPGGKIPSGDPAPALNPPDDIDIEDLPSPLTGLVNRIQQIGAHVWLKDLTSDLAIPAIAAGILQEIRPGRCFIGVGFGAHPDRIVAAQRAITEAVLGRAVQVQGTREKSVRSYSEPGVPGTQGIWWVDSNHRKPFSELPSTEYEDIFDDITLMLGCLKKRKVSHVIVVKITDDAIGIPVVRMIIPDLESWAAFDFDEKFCSLGGQAQKFLL